MLFKKNVAASDSPCAIRVACARPFGYQIPSSGVVLKAAHHFFSGGVARVCGGGMIGLRQAFFFSSLFSLSRPRNSRQPIQKHNCVL